MVELSPLGTAGPSNGGISESVEGTNAGIEGLDDNDEADAWSYGEANPIRTN